MERAMYFIYNKNKLLCKLSTYKWTKYLKNMYPDLSIIKKKYCKIKEDWIDDSIF